MDRHCAPFVVARRSKQTRIICRKHFLRKQKPLWTRWYPSVSPLRAEWPFKTHSVRGDMLLRELKAGRLSPRKSKRNKRLKGPPCMQLVRCMAFKNSNRSEEHTSEL